jgi:hypothetical protein
MALLLSLLLGCLDVNTSLEGCGYHIAAQAIPRSACMAIARE